MCTSLLLGLLLASGPIVIVESVDTGSVAERAGLAAGDRITAWSQGTNSGLVETPFDLEDAEQERAPRGPVTLSGSRAEGPFTLALADETWGVRGRPDLPGALVSAVEAARRAEGAGQQLDAAQAFAGLADGPLAPPSRSWLHLQSANAFRGASRLEDAQLQYEAALAGLGPRATAGVWMLRASAYMAADRRPEMKDAYQRAAELFASDGGESLRYAEALRMAARFQIDFSDTSVAAGLHRGTRIAESLAPDSLFVAQFWKNEASRMHWEGNNEAATSLVNRACALQSRKAPGSQALAATLVNLSVYAADEGDLATAEASLRKALEILETPGMDAYYHSGALMNLGSVLVQRGDLDAAEDALKRALEVGGGLPPMVSTAPMALINLGQLAARRREPAQARDFYAEALRLLEPLSDQGKVGPLVGLGELALDKADLEMAETYFARARSLYGSEFRPSPLAAQILTDLAEVARARGDVSRAEALYREVVGLQSSWRAGSFEEAMALGRLASLRARAGRPDEAAALYADAIRALERQRGRLGREQEWGSLRMADFSDLYAEYVGVLLKLGQPDEAFRILEASRARSLLKLLAQRDMAFLRDIPADLDRERRDIKANYDRLLAALGDADPQADSAGAETLRAQMRDLQQARLRLAANIQEASPRLAGIEDPHPLSLPEARRVLDPGTLLLSYIVGPDETFLFAVEPATGHRRSPDGLRVFKIPAGRSALRDKVSAFLALLGNPDAPSADGMAAELYRLLVAPAEDLVSAHDRILVSPDGPLQTIPFAALVRSRTAAGRPAFLAEWRPVHAIASATLYADVRQRRGRSRPATPTATIAAFGDPVYPGGQQTADEVALRSGVRGGSLSALPETRREVRRIEELFPREVASYLGADATEENAKALPAATRYVHFACHALLNSRSPLDSALVLSLPETPTEGRDNGLLQAWEIFEDVRIDADLVTLSACQSGLGAEVGGEGLVGLTRAFQYAGARSVLASLWNVADASTADLMTVFYRKLKEGKAKDEALQEAQIAMIRRGYSPFHWAAFQLTGDRR